MTVNENTILLIGGPCDQTVIQDPGWNPRVLIQPLAYYSKKQLHYCRAEYAPTGLGTARFVQVKGCIRNTIPDEDGYEPCGWLPEEYRTDDTAGDTQRVE